VTAASVGTSFITADDGGDPATAVVTVIAYRAADRAAGESAFTTYHCDGCHAATLTPPGPDITSSGIGKHSDDQIVAAVMQGRNPEGASIEVGHTFPLTTAEAAGIAAFLRSQPARGVPQADE